MEDLKLCESDYRFMCVIWENEPLHSGRLVELCAERLGWKKPTTYTTLKKLIDKGFAKNEETVVTSLIPKEKVCRAASEHFVDHTFAGSLPGFLVAFLGDKKLSKSEAEELKQLIDQHRKE
ncbi:MAG: BlaI/MecI/CopY family transcriptional regulator [Ruminococcaceae bacterium]|nr:BlaI/MecI/CopY family transcriptional regulator [Oscillospiraceae bacterium]